MPKTDLLPLLADGEFHSGQELADVLGVSRTAVWKQLQRLDELGLQVESSKVQGYRLVGGLDLLDEPRLVSLLKPEAAACLSSFDILETVDSTNAYVLRQMAEGAMSGCVCSAEQQDAGRGRRGRDWVSPFARNIYVSLGWQFNRGAASLEGLSLAVGVAIAEALGDCGIDGVTLKWPNDLMYKRAKLGGVLIEMSGDASGVCQVVVGIGLNVNMPPEQATAIEQNWTDLASMHPGKLPSRNEVLAAILSRVLPLLAHWDETGFAPWRERWRARDAFADSSVQVIIGEQVVTGIASGVDERGALLLETSAGVQPFLGGEISMRDAADA
ncbi:MAG: bifunctional biotin--[acetyl-CoA-carboxylase] synthetase/biotin operon repressor [Gammaproteobacteria bacterium]|nr:MAG: bifunctional biotin--[acetyl-CoA-carboxylase] synthetase/biotin operon repressor [Gammaproteobacteria bacterium]